MTREDTSTRRPLQLVGIIVMAALAIGVAAWASYSLRPLGLPPGEAYFEPPGQRVLQPDEVGQWNYMMNEYDLLEYTGDTFANWDPATQSDWKYSIAFASYGMPSLAIIDPEQADMVRYHMWVMIKKMKSKKVWLDWEAFGFGEDPISHHNIMYKGHLNLMYGLYELMGGDDRFSREYTWLTNQIVDEIREHHHDGVYDGTNCEPDQYFPQCNSIGLLSLLVYDKLYGTDYANNEVRWVLDFIHQRLIDPETGLYWLEYHPSHDNTERYLSGYTTAWCMVFLRPFEPEYNEKLYPVWKKTFVTEKGRFAWVAERPGGGMWATAQLFGLLAAKEFGDVELFTKLRNTLDYGKLGPSPEFAEMRYRDDDNTRINGWTLAFKLHVGWQTILDHDWGQTATREIPSVEGMTWTDVLPQEIWELTPQLGGRQTPLVPTSTACVPMPPRSMLREASTAGGG